MFSDTSNAAPSAWPPSWPRDVTGEDLRLLEQQKPDTDEQRLQQCLQVAWHLRQRDGTRSLALVEEVSRRLKSALPSAAVDQAAARLQLLRAEHAWLQADLGVARQLAESAGQSFEALGDGLGQADTSLLLGAVALDGSHFEEARRWLRLAEQAGDAQRRAVSRGMQAYWGLVSDALTAGRSWDDEMAAQQQHADPIQAMWAWMYRGMTAIHIERLTEAIPATLRAAELAHLTGQLRHAIGARVNISVAYTNLNDPATALHWIQQALDLARSTGWPASLGMCLSHMAALLTALQNRAEARKACCEAQRVLQPLAESHTLAAVSRFLADLDVEAGELDSGIEAYRAMLARRPALDRILTYMVCCGLGRALTLRGDRAEALATLERALAIARDDGRAAAQVRALQLMGELHTRLPQPAPPGMNQPNASLQCFSQAVAVAAAVPGYTVEAALWDQLAQAHAQAGDWAQAYPLAQRAAAARDLAQERETRQRAMALALRHEVESARTHSERLREQARQAAQHAALLQASHATLQQLSLIGQEITGQLDIDTVFSRIHGHLQALVDVSHLSIWLLQPDGRTLSLRFGVEDHQRMAPAQVQLDADFSKVARCLREQREILHDSPPDTAEPAHMPGTLRTHTALFGPMQVRGRTVGVLSIQSTRINAYGERERLVFRALCAYGAIALDNAAAYKQMRLAERALRRAHAGERQARLQAQDATRLKNDLLSRVSRDLRAPLAHLHDSLQDAEGSAGRASPEALRASLESALSRSHEVNTLARELLELARLESGAVLPMPERFSLADLAHDVLQKCADLLSRRRLRVNVLPLVDACEVVADIGMIERVLTELVGHAATRSADGGELGLRVLAQGQRIRVEVADSGPPLADKAAAELLLRPNRAGAGLGLVIACEMLQLHGQVLALQRGGSNGLVMSFELRQAGP